jgi:CubicO group peptidase (beta-lactamase class C family)
MSAAVVQRGAFAWSDAFGFSDLEQKTPARADSRCQTASVAKPIAAVLILQLVEEGKLSLDTPMKEFQVHRWFAPHPKRYREQPVLVRHVLSHTSEGLPGNAYSYNGNTYFDLTWVVEDVTRTAYPRALQERIFDRAGMDRSVPGYVRPGTTEVVDLVRPHQCFDPVYRIPEDALVARKALLGEGFMHLTGPTQRPRSPRPCSTSRSSTSPSTRTA